MIRSWHRTPFGYRSWSMNGLRRSTYAGDRGDRCHRSVEFLLDKVLRSTHLTHSTTNNNFVHNRSLTPRHRVSQPRLKMVYAAKMRKTFPNSIPIEVPSLAPKTSIPKERNASPASAARPGPILGRPRPGDVAHIGPVFTARTVFGSARAPGWVCTFTKAIVPESGGGGFGEAVGPKSTGGWRDLVGFFSAREDAVDLQSAFAGTRRGGATNS